MAIAVLLFIMILFHPTLGSGFGSIIGELPWSGEDGGFDCRQTSMSDKHLVADTLEEAVKNFADLTLPYSHPDLEEDERVSKKRNGELDISGKSLGDPGSCETESCKHCSGLLLHRLKEIGMIDAVEETRLTKKLNATEKASSDKCKRIILTDDDTPPPERKRVTRSPGEDGLDYDIKCIKAGSQIIPGEPWIGFCDLCWTIRKLPEGYSPRYLNELSLGQRTKCIGGHGNCRPFHRNVNTVLTTGTGRSVTKTLQMVRSVECNIKPDSDLLQLAKRAERVDFELILRPQD